MNNLSQNQRQTIEWAIRVADGLRENMNQVMWIYKNETNVMYRLKYDRAKAKHQELTEHIVTLISLLKGYENV